MKSFDDIRGGLESCESPETGRPTNEFWQEFSQRASGLPREAPIRSRTPMVVGAAVACACLLVAAGGAWFLRTPRPEVTAERIQSLQIDVPYDGVVILDDADSPVTILWVDET